MADVEQDPIAFLASYGKSAFPHRDVVVKILSDGEYRCFYGGRNANDNRAGLTCAHYASIYRLRERHIWRLMDEGEASAQLIAKLPDVKCLWRKLSETPDEVCDLFLCETDAATYSLFVRPGIPDVAGCIAHPRDEEGD